MKYTRRCRIICNKYCEFEEYSSQLSSNVDIFELLYVSVGNIFSGNFKHVICANF